MLTILFALFFIHVSFADDLSGNDKYGDVGTYSVSDQSSANNIEELDPKTGHTTKYTIFLEDGETAWYISERDPKTGKQTKITEFRTYGNKTLW